MILFYIRHGNPIYSPDSLTPLGERQAESVAKRLALFGVDRIFSSTSNRAYQTAVPTSQILRKPITKLDFCNEGHVWEELTVTLENDYKTWIFASPEHMKLFVSEEVRKLGYEWYNHEAFDTERCRASVERVNRETDKFFSDLGYEHDREMHAFKIVKETDERIALFAHQGFFESFMSSILDIPYPQFCTHFDTTHTGITAVDFSGLTTGRFDDYVIPRILTLSNDSHLYKDGLPLRYCNLEMNF